MHANFLWLLVGLAAVGLGAWRIITARTRAQAMRAEREQAMAMALAAAQAAARESLARKQAEARSGPPAITRTITRPTAAPRPAPAAQPPKPPLSEARLAAHLDAQRIAIEAARRARSQKAQRVESGRQAAHEDPATREAAARPAPAPILTPVVVAPVAPVAPPPAPVKSPAETVILLADDSKMVRVKTSRLLEGNAYRVVTAVDGLDAVRQLESVRPDLVITDVDMPGMDGFGLTRHLRGNASTAHIPIVMITSAEDRHRDDALREGVGLVLGKPYPEDALLAHIRSFNFTAAATA